MRRTRNRTLLAAAVAVAATLAGCGSDDDDSSAPETTGAAPASSGSTVTSGSSSGSEVDVAALAQDALTPPTVDDLPITTELPGAAPELDVVWLPLNIPAGIGYNRGAEEAAEAIGFNLEIISVDPVNPAPAYQQAIDIKPDAILAIGVGAAQIEDQLEAAKEAGIPVILSDGTDEPTGADGNNLYVNFNGLTAQETAARRLAAYVADDSGGEAKAVLVTSKDLTSLVYQQQFFEQAMGEYCASCTVDELLFPLSDLGTGALPGKLVSYLQSNPDVNYIVFAFADVSAGSPEAIEDSGLGDGVKMVGFAPDKTVLQAIVDGAQDAWVQYAKDYRLWAMMDTAARLKLGADLEDGINVEPTYVIDSADEASKYISDGYWRGPDGYEDYFRGLWGR